MLQTRLQLFEYLKDENLINKITTADCKRKLCDYVFSKLPDLPVKTVTNTVSFFSMKICYRWKASGRNIKNFLKRNQEWLEKNLIHQNFCSAKKVSTSTSTKTLIGRPKKLFTTLSTRSKQRYVKTFISSHSTEELTFAAQMGFNKKGQRTTAHVIKKASTSSPRTLKLMKKEPSLSNIRTYTANAALALILDCKLTKDQYIQLRNGARVRNINLYPAYNTILEAKKQCYPDEQAVTITETMAEVKLQKLLDITTERLCSVQNEVILDVLNKRNDCLFQITYKWGFDGSSSHSLYKQKFVEDLDATDSDIFLSSIVPLKMTAKTDFSEDIVWQNPRTSSTKYCRPIKLQFLKESDELIKKEGEYIENQVLQLKSTLVNIEGHEIKVHHSLLQTMVDGKVANSLNDNKSSQTCYICKATPKQMNNIDHVLKRPCNVISFKYGLSTLHAHIRFFECILHLSYRLPFKTWRIKDGTAEYTARKKEIITKLREETGLLVDVIKQGKGNTNDGNTARRFFRDPAQAARITEVDESLIKQFAVILEAISCGYKLNTDVFRTYALATARNFVLKYPWYYMSASVHKILIHGADAMDYLLLPIGQLSEEALEARHKECRYYREHNTRKVNRRKNMEDLFHILLLSSDPLISSMRKISKKKTGALSQEVIQLIQLPEFSLSTDKYQNLSSSEEELDTEVDFED